ncbi:MAG TPA: hypothetical protein P5277_02385 [Candidatus Paceibacterota bacterium]|nr:hypothetical protein [Candidatus Paceibacterota bacterium]
MKKSMSKNLLRILVALTVFVISLILVLSNVSALITGKIGNGRMVLNLESGDKIDRSILVINDNNVTVNITLFSSEEIMNMVEIKDKSFILKPGEQKKAAFTLTAKEPGKYEGKVNVKFTPVDSEEGGVGLSSQIYLTVYKDGELPENIDSKNDNLNPNTDNNVSDFFNKLVYKVVENKLAALLLCITLILIFAIALLFYVGKRKKNESLNKLERELKKSRDEKNGEKLKTMEKKL